MNTFGSLVQCQSAVMTSMNPFSWATLPSSDLQSERRRATVVVVNGKNKFLFTCDSPSLAHRSSTQTCKITSDCKPCKPKSKQTNSYMIQKCFVYWHTLDWRHEQNTLHDVHSEGKRSKFVARLNYENFVEPFRERCICVMSNDAHNTTLDSY